jgi:hypothetical protein
MTPAELARNDQERQLGPRPDCSSVLLFPGTSVGPVLRMVSNHPQT